MADYRENVLVVLKDRFLNEKCSLDSITDFVTISNYIKLFSVQNISSIEDTITFTNSLLNSSKTRQKGLLLLKAVIAQSSTAVYTRYEKQWQTSLLQILQSHDSELTYGVCCDVIYRVLDVSSGLSQCSRDVSATFLPELLPRLLDATEHWIESAILCINVCLQKYSSSCGPFRGKIDQCVQRLVDTPALLGPVSQCYALLAQGGSGGMAGVKHSEAWGQRLASALGEISNSYVLLTADMETGNVGLKDTGLTLPSLPESHPTRDTTLLHRIRFFVRSCSNLLVGEFPVAVKVPIQDILQIVSLLTDVDAVSLVSRATTALLTLAAYVPIIQSQGLQLLHSLIDSCKTLLVPYVSRVNRLLMRVLLWSHSDGDGTDVGCGQDQPFSALRTEAYHTLDAWLTHLGYTCHLDNDIADLVGEILLDVKPRLPSIKLPSTTVSTNKKKKKGHFHELKEDRPSEKSDPLANVDTCKAALKVLHQLLHACGSRMKPKQLKDIQTFLLSMCLDIQQRAKGPYPAPYSSCDVRKRLYRALLACTLVSHPTWPPPVQMAVKTFELACRDPSNKVAAFSSEAYAIVEMMIHPRIPCVQPAVKLVENSIGVTAADLNRTDKGKAIPVDIANEQSRGETDESRMETDEPSGIVNGPPEGGDGRGKRKLVEVESVDLVKKTKQSRELKNPTFVDESSGSDDSYIEESVDDINEAVGNNRDDGASVDNRSRKDDDGDLGVDKSVDFKNGGDGKFAAAENADSAIDVVEIRSNEEMVGDEEKAKEMNDNIFEIIVNDRRGEDICQAEIGADVERHDSANSGVVLSSNKPDVCQTKDFQSQSDVEKLQSAIMPKDDLNTKGDVEETISDESSQNSEQSSSGKRERRQSTRNRKRIDWSEIAAASPRHLTRSTLKALTEGGSDDQAHNNGKTQLEKDAKETRGRPGFDDNIHTSARRTRSKKGLGKDGESVCESSGSVEDSQDATDPELLSPTVKQNSLEEMLSSFVDVPPEKD